MLGGWNHGSNSNVRFLCKGIRIFFLEGHSHYTLPFPERNWESFLPSPRNIFPHDASEPSLVAVVFFRFSSNKIQKKNNNNNNNNNNKGTLKTWKDLRCPPKKNLIISSSPTCWMTMSATTFSSRASEEYLQGSHGRCSGPKVFCSSIVVYLRSTPHPGCQSQMKV